jgi:HAD superfamily hydrolase (TIGR01509 family)
MKPPLKLIIFDCDGVLVDSEPLANRALVEQMASLGFCITPAECDVRYRGISMASMLKKIESDNSTMLPATFEQQLQERTYGLFDQHLTAIAGVEDLLHGMQNAALKICVASSGRHRKIRFSLTKTALLHYFSSNIFSAEDVDRGKPAPDLFLYAAQKMQVNPRHAVVIEDSVPGLQAGVAAGIKTLFYQPKTDAKTFTQAPIAAAQGCISFSHMCEVPALLGELFQVGHI